MFDIYTIIFLALAVFIFFRLRSVLGQRTGRERSPYDPYSTRDAVRSPANNDKIVTLPQRPAEPAVSRPPADPSPPPADRWKDVAEAGSSVAAGLDAIAGVDQGFDAKHFLTGARAAYEIIVTAFAEGNRKTLKNLLSSDVYQGFAGAIGDRESRGEQIDQSFVGIKSADIVEAELKNGIAQLTIKFDSELISATRDRAGDVISGDPKRIKEVTDIWTFAREITSRDPNWKLIATQAAN